MVKKIPVRAAMRLSKQHASVRKHLLSFILLYLLNITSS